MLEQSIFSTTSSDALVAESNHRIANNLALVAGFLEQQGRQIAKRGQPIEPDEVRAMLAAASMRITTAGELHRLLISRSDSAIDLGAYLGRVSQQTVEALADPSSIELVVATSHCVIPAEHALKVALIVGELVVNAIKYAHPGGVHGHIEVGCRGHRDGSVEIWVADDGVGLPEGFDPAKFGGLGMRTMRAIAQQMRAVLTLEDSGVGLLGRLVMPSACAAATHA